MLSQQVISLVGFRLGLMKWGLFSYFDWDKKERKVVPPNNYILLNMYFGGIAVLMFPFAHISQMCLLLLFREKDDYGNNISFSATQFASLVIEWGEISLGVAFFGLNLCVVKSWKKIIYFFNQLFTYNQEILDMLKEKEIDLDPTHRKTTRLVELTATVFNFFTTVLPLGLSFVVFHPMEPTHIIIRDWLEIDFSPSLTLLPWILLFFFGILGAANLIAVTGHMVLCYHLISTTVLNDLRPVRLHHKKGLQVSVETQFYGVIEDIQVVEIYMQLRLLNVLINDVVANFWLALHQIGLLGTASVLAFFVVKCHTEILENGAIGVLVVGGSLISPFLVVYFQSKYFGELRECSDQFREVGRKLVPRKTMYRRFVRSCQTFYVEEAYPFYKIGKDTFLAFWGQVVDYAVTLLLWRQ